MIDLIDVSKSYGPGLPAVNHANLHVDKDEKCLPQTNAAGTEITNMKLNTPESPYTSCILQPSARS